MTAAKVPCDGGFDCPLPLSEHDEDTDCYAVTCVPPACSHGQPVVECRECAANPPEGWQLVECDQDHPVMWMPDDGWSYPPPCMYCSYELFAAAHRECEHATHGRWRRWRLSHWLACRAYALGVIVAFGTKSGGGCTRCLTYLKWRGRRSYILGWSVDSWRCLLKFRHWPGEEVGLGFCAKCLPCQTCGSHTAGHNPGCADA